MFAMFAEALRPGGVLILDVREWEASAVRKAREPLFRKAWRPSRHADVLERYRLDRENRRFILSERHTLLDDRQERSSDYQFVMRCWTRAELHSRTLTSAGFAKVTYFGAYDEAVQAGRTDRLVAVAQLSDAGMATRKSREFDTSTGSPRGRGSHQRGSPGFDSFDWSCLLPTRRR